MVESEQSTVARGPEFSVLAHTAAMRRMALKAGAPCYGTDLETRPLGAPADCFSNDVALSP
jgi:hypothetical protein